MLQDRGYKKRASKRYGTLVHFEYFHCCRSGLHKVNAELKQTFSSPALINRGTYSNTRANWGRRK